MLLDAAPDIELSPSGRRLEAVKARRLLPDVVLMDLHAAQGRARYT
jgi:hypothetical protein